MKTKETRYLPTREIRATKADDGTRTLTGYAAVFNTRSVDLGGFVEEIAPGAFAKTLARSTTDVLMLRDHDTSILLGRTASGTLKLSEDATGLRYECQLPNTSQARDLCELIDREDIVGNSIGFYTERDAWTHTDDGDTLRTLIDLELFDVSAVTSPAYPETSLSLRSAPPVVRAVIEARKKMALRDNACTCDCAACVGGDCDGCTTDDMNCEETCSCPTHAEAMRNRMHFTLEIARLRP